MFAIVIMAECIMSAMQNLAHTINSGLLVMSFCNFEGEDVVKCMFILCNILHFLNCGISGFDCMPLLLMDDLHNVFMSVMNTQFHNCVQNLKDFHWDNVNTPEALFIWVQDCCDNINAKPGAVWLKTKNQRPHSLLVPLLSTNQLAQLLQ